MENYLPGTSRVPLEVPLDHTEGSLGDPEDKKRWDTRDTHPHVVTGFALILPVGLQPLQGSSGKSLEQSLSLLGILAAGENMVSERHTTPCLQCRPNFLWPRTYPVPM